MKVTGCKDCPFRVDEYDDWATGYDSIAYCKLAHFKKQKDWIILTYYGPQEPEITTPDWCPLDELTIKKYPK